MTLQRRLARVRAHLEARSAPLSVVCRDAVDLWRVIYGREPDDWQREVLLSRSPRLLLNCCRQAGKSSVCAVLGLYEALYHAPALVLLVSASLRQAQELGKKLFDAYKALGKPIPAEAENRLSLELASGSRIMCLPAKEGTVRGFSGSRLILVDEAARVPDPLYHAVRPMLAVSAGRLICLSTPCGKRGFFHREWTEGRGWLKVHITAEQCPRISAEFLAEERQSLPAWVFESEYHGVFGDTLDSVFRSEDIQAALSDEIAPLFASGVTNDAHPFVISELLSRS